MRSDGLTSFTGSPSDYVHGSEDNTLAILQSSSGNYLFSTRLDTRKPLRRRLCLDFGAQPSPFASPHCADVVFGTIGDERLQDMRYGDVLDKRARHEWTAGGYRYYLGFGTDWNGDGALDTLPVTVACTAPELSPTSPCTFWTMTPTGQASLVRQQVLKGGRLGPPTFIGYYDMPFEVSFTRK